MKKNQFNEIFREINLQVALIIEDTEFSEGIVNGERTKCGKIAGSLRKKLMSEHLGPEINVRDCISDAFYKETWFRIASKNTKLFEEIFLCIPTDKVTTMSENRSYLSKLPMTVSDKYLALQKLKELQGSLVLLPLHYLENEYLSPSLLAKEGLVPTKTWT